MALKRVLALGPVMPKTSYAVLCQSFIGHPFATSCECENFEHSERVQQSANSATLAFVTLISASFSIVYQCPLSCLTRPAVRPGDPEQTARVVSAAVSLFTMAHPLRRSASASNFTIMTVRVHLSRLEPRRSCES